MDGFESHEGHGGGGAVRSGGLENLDVLERTVAADADGYFADVNVDAEHALELVGHLGRSVAREDR